MTHIFKTKPLILATVVAAVLGTGYTPSVSATSGDYIVSPQPNGQGLFITPFDMYDNVIIPQNVMLTSDTYAINNSGIASTLTNKGQLTGGVISLYNRAHLSELNNEGNIRVSATNADAINNTNVIDTLNNSGIILVGSANDSSHAIMNSGTIGTLINSGQIYGNISSSTSLTIAGGSGNSFGILTGYSSDDSMQMGRIYLFRGSLTFSSGNLLLNDGVILDNSTEVTNTGANLMVIAPVNISANYTQSENASLTVLVLPGATANGSTSDTGYGRLDVDGSVTIAQGSSVKMVGQGYSFASGQRFVVVTTRQGQNTNFNESTLHYSATNWNGDVSGSSVTVDQTKMLVVSLTGGTTPPSNNNGGNGAPPDNGTTTPPNTGQNHVATRPNAVSSLTGLQNYTGVADASLLNLYNASLAVGTKTEANKAGEQLSPVINTGAGQAASTATFDMLNVIGARMDAVRTAQAYGQSGISTGDSMTNSAAWGQLFGGRAHQGATSEMSGYKANYGGFVLGADHDVTDAWRLGGAVSYTATRVDGRDNLGGTDADVNAWGLTAYANYQASDWYANLYATAVTQRYKTQRSVDFTGYAATAEGKFSGQQYALKAEFGLPLALTQTVTLTPLANLSYSYLNQEGYTESNGNGSALKVDAAHSDAIKSGLGAKLQVVADTGLGQVAPYVQALWYHQYDAKAMNVSAAYAAATDETGFVSRGSTPEKDSVGGRVGVTLVHAGTRSVETYYDITAAPHYTNQSVSLQFKQQF